MLKGQIADFGGKKFSCLTYADWWRSVLNGERKEIKSKLIHKNGETFMVVDTGHLLVNSYSKV